jgi:penicillin-binding protein 2
LIALLALQEGAITPNEEYYCGGGHPRGNGEIFNCLAEHGSVNVVEALMHSCNTFFFEMMKRIDVNSMNRLATAFGFGSKPYLDIATTEIQAGLVPDSAYYNRNYGERGGWNVGWIMNLGVGQGELSVSPLQLVRYLSALANGGTLVAPHLVRSLVDSESGEITVSEYPRTTLDLNPTYVGIVKEGMRRVIREKSSWLEIPGITSIGKTGSAQNSRHEEDDSIFIIAAPAETPRIAIAILIENAGYGSTAAGPIGSFMAERYLKGFVDYTPARRDLMDLMFTKNSAPLASN